MTRSEAWRSFVDGPLYAADQAPWRDDPAFAIVAEHAGLRDSLGGHVARALTLAIDLVRATTGVDLPRLAQARRPALGLCLGFGMNALEPYDLLQVFGLDRVHAYEWIAEQVVDAARTLHALAARTHADLQRRIRLHHGTLSDLRALADASVQVVYAAHVFSYEIPMTPATFEGACQEMLRVLRPEGVVLSRGSAGTLESHLAPHGRLLLHTPLITVFQKPAEDR